MIGIAAALLALAACPAPPRPSPSPTVVDTDAVSTGWTGAATEESPVVRTWPVMGAVLQLSVWDADTVRALAAMEAARAAVLRADSVLSTEIAAWSRAGTDSAVALSVETVRVLESARSIAEASGRALEAADLGGMVKGFAIDRARDALRAAGVRRAVVDLGGSFAVLGPAPVGPRWSVALENPFQPGEVFAAVQLDSGAAATVGDSALAGVRTSQPVYGIASVSVTAPNAVLAVAMARAFFAMGPGEGCRLAARYPGVDAVWVRAPGAEEREEAERDADEGVDPELVVITDALADRLELLSEEPTDERPTQCSGLSRR